MNRDALVAKFSQVVGVSKAESIVSDGERALGFDRQATYSGDDIRDLCEEIATEYDGYIAEIATEIRVQTQAQQQFDTLLENVPDPAVVVTFAESVPVVKTVNRAFETVFGYESETIRGEPLDELIVPTGAASGMEVWATEDDGGREVTRLTASGEERTFLQRTAMETSMSGTVEGYGIYTDITDRIERERDLHMLKQLFSRVFRHNIRNELTVVSGQLSYLFDRLNDDALLTHARAAMQAADRLLSHSEKTREIERLIDTTPERIEMPVSDVVDEAMADQSPFPDDVSVTVDLPEESVHVVDGFATAVANAIENAVAHNPPPVALSVSATRSGEVVSLVVADDGDGIAADETAMLTSGEETPLVHGSGVGLWVMDWYVKKSGGTLDITGDDSGTTVRMDLKRVQSV